MRKIRVVIPHGMFACDHAVIAQNIRRPLPTGEVVEVSFGHRKEVTNGVWMSADAETAKLCGVKFDDKALAAMLGKSEKAK